MSIFKSERTSLPFFVASNSVRRIHPSLVPSRTSYLLYLSYLWILLSGPGTPPYRLNSFGGELESPAHLDAFLLAVQIEVSESLFLVFHSQEAMIAWKSRYTTYWGEKDAVHYVFLRVNDFLEVVKPRKRHSEEFILESRNQKHLLRHRYHFDVFLVTSDLPTMRPWGSVRL